MKTFRDSPCVQTVSGFEALVATRFAGNINALCWTRALAGDFGEIVLALGQGEGIRPVDERRLLRLRLSPAGERARQVLLDDLQLLRERGLAPELNCIHGYPRDDASAAVATDVFSFHADRAPIEADTYLCTYHGSPSEALDIADARRRIDDPATRAALRGEFGGEDDRSFEDWLRENCYDLHYAAVPGAQPYSFGLGHLWRIALEHPDRTVPPCVHRAPATIPGAPRLLLIS